MSELLAMMRDMQGQIKELKDKQSADVSVSTPKASTSGAMDFQSTVSPQTPLSTSTHKKVSDIFKNYKFCPSPRKEQMPKKKKLSLRDQTFAISSTKGIAFLQAERDEKIQLEDEKKKKQMERQKKRETQIKGKAKPQGGGAKKSLKRKFEEVTQEEESSEESLSLEDAPRSPSSSENPSLLFTEQYQNEVLEVIDQDLNAGQIVMTKIQMKGVSQKGRKSATYMSFLGQVIRDDEEGAIVDFFKEVKGDFFTKQPENKDVAFVARNEMTTLSDMCYQWTKDGRVFGLKLKEGIRSLCLEKLGLA